MKNSSENKSVGYQKKEQPRTHYNPRDGRPYLTEEEHLEASRVCREMEEGADAALRELFGENLERLDKKDFRTH